MQRIIRDDARNKVKAGVTTAQEVLNVSMEE